MPGLVGSLLCFGSRSWDDLQRRLTDGADRPSRGSGPPRRVLCQRKQQNQQRPGSVSKRVRDQSSELTWAFAPPMPNEFTLALSRPWGHGVTSTGTSSRPFSNGTAISVIAARFALSQSWGPTLRVWYMEVDVWRDCLMLQRKYRLYQATRSRCSFSVANIRFHLRHHELH